MNSIKKTNSLSGTVLEIILFCLLIFSPLIHGGISPVALAVIESLCILFCGLFLFTTLRTGDTGLIKFPYIPVAGFIALVVFQLYPLPVHLIKTLSPATSALYESFSITKDVARTITIYPDASVGMLLQILAYISVCLALLHHADSKQKINRLIAIVIICGTIYSLYGIFKGLPTKSLRYSTFTNANHFAAYMEMIIPLTIAYAFITKKRLMKSFYIFAAFIQIVALALSLSRAGISCCFIGIVSLCILITIKKGLHKILLITATLAVGLGIFFAVVGTLPIMKELSTLSNISTAYANRFVTLKDSLNILKDFPLFGVGLNAFEYIIQKYNTLGFWSIGFSHNEPVQLLTETGIAGFLLILTFLCAFFAPAIKVWNTRHDPHAVYVTAACFAGMLSIALHSFFEFLLHVPAVFLLACIILALAFRTSYIKSEQHALAVPSFRINIPRYARNTILFLLIATLLVMGSAVLARGWADTLYNTLTKNRLVLLGTETSDAFRSAFSDIDSAIKFNPLNADYISRKADIALILAQRDAATIKASGFSNPAQAWTFAEALYKQAIDMAPTRAPYRVNLAHYYRTRGLTELARFELERSLMLDPQNNKIKQMIRDAVRTYNMVPQ